MDIAREAGPDPLDSAVEQLSVRASVNRRGVGRHVRGSASDGVLEALSDDRGD